MGSAARYPRFSVEEYLLRERHSLEKHEYVDGQIVAMAGGSARHNYLIGRILYAFTARLQGGSCYPLSSDQRIATGEGLFTYPDVSVFCGQMDLQAGETGTNPVVLVEVLSDSTREYDRREKLERYKQVPSVQHVILVDQDTVDVEVWTRGPVGWTRKVHTEPGEVLTLSTPAVELPVAEIYAGIERLPA